MSIYEMEYKAKIEKAIREDDNFFYTKQGTRPVLVKNSKGKYKGYFHKFATLAEEGNSEELALIEDYQGNCNLEFVENIRFLDYDKFLE